MVEERGLSQSLSKVTRSVDISAPVDRVFNYYARPEHIAKTFPEEVKMKVVPIKVTEGFGLGTVFRISGEFGGRPLEWDNETVAYEKNKIIQTKAINGPFKKNVVTVSFDRIDDGSTKLSFDIDYELGYGLFGKAYDKMKLKKEIELGIERSCSKVKKSVEAGKSVEEAATTTAAA
jgi:uncharacterized membrane protein